MEEEYILYKAYMDSQQKNMEKQKAKLGLWDF